MKRTLALLILCACGEPPPHTHASEPLPAALQGAPVNPHIPVRVCTHLQPEPAQTLPRRSADLERDLQRRGLYVERRRAELLVLRGPAREIESLFKVKLRHLPGEWAFGPETPPTLPPGVVSVHGLFWAPWRDVDDAT